MLPASIDGVEVRIPERYRVRDSPQMYAAYGLECLTAADASIFDVLMDSRRGTLDVTAELAGKLDNLAYGLYESLARVTSYPKGLALIQQVL